MSLFLCEHLSRLFKSTIVVLSSFKLKGNYISLLKVNDQSLWVFSFLFSKKKKKNASWYYYGQSSYWIFVVFIRNGSDTRLSVSYRIRMTGWFMMFNTQATSQIISGRSATAYNTTESSTHTPCYVKTKLGQNEVEWTGREQGVQREKNSITNWKTVILKDSKVRSLLCYKHK